MTNTVEKQAILQTSPIINSSTAQQPPVFGLVVGEHSGDTLGAGLMSSLISVYPNAKFIGIGGPKMQALGFESLFEMEELSVMGIFEVLGRLKRLFHVKDCLAAQFINDRPDVFIGIDAPDFNLRLERQLKKAGIKTVHYVSPSVWAWREKRIFTIEAATDMVLSLLPFEKDFYDKYEVPCTFVGHPLADDIPFHSDKREARQALNLPLDKKILALMPGSRGGELSRLTEPFLLSAVELLAQDPQLHFVVPMISDKRTKQFSQLKEKIAPNLAVTIITNKTQQVMAASDCLLMASGTVTLEAALVKRPMVICYKFNAFTYHMFKGLVKLEWFSLPNLLTKKTLVPELLQGKVSVDNIVPLVKERLYQDQTSLEDEYMKIHLALKQNASQEAAKAVMDLMSK
jgi:lipid-A-disaccharide synthase